MTTTQSPQAHLTLKAKASAVSYAAIVWVALLSLSIAIALIDDARVSRLACAGILVAMAVVCVAVSWKARQSHWRLVLDGPTLLVERFSAGAAELVARLDVNGPIRLDVSIGKGMAQLEPLIVMVCGSERIEWPVRIRPAVAVEQVAGFLESNGIAVERPSDIPIGWLSSNRAPYMPPPR